MFDVMCLEVFGFIYEEFEVQVGCYFVVVWEWSFFLREKFIVLFYCEVMGFDIGCEG